MILCPLCRSWADGSSSPVFRGTSGLDGTAWCRCGRFVMSVDGSEVGPLFGFDVSDDGCFSPGLFFRSGVLTVSGIGEVPSDEAWDVVVDFLSMAEVSEVLQT